MPQVDPIISLLIILLTEKDSDFYIPKILQGCKDPKLEPYTNADISLGTFPLMKRDYQLVLTDLKIEGISNIQVEKEGPNKDKPRIYIDGPAVQFYAQRPNTEAPMPQLPVKLKVNGDLIITPVGSNPLPKIHLTAEIEHAQLLGEFDATSQDSKPETIRVTFKKLALLQMLDRADNIVLKIEAKSVLDQMLNKIINQDSTKLKLVTAINEQLSSATLLNALSAEATKAAIAALSIKR